MGRTLRPAHHARWTALSSVAVAPPRLPPPPCQRTHCAPLACTTPWTWSARVTPMSRVVDLYAKSHAIPFVGDRLFSFAFSQVAPYFWTIRPRFTVIEPNHAEVVIPKRRGVKNHIGTVHAIALCNGLEAAMGVLAEASIPRDKRWIPKGMEVSYTAKATSDI